MKLRLIILFLLGIQGAYSQSIIIDWQNFDESIKNAELLESVPFGKFHSFQIKDINKFLYKVTVQGANIELETPIPTELQTLFRVSKGEREETAKNTELANAVKNSETENSLLNSFLVEMQLGALGVARDPAVVEREQDLQNFFQKNIELQNLFIRISDMVYSLKLIKVKLINHALKDIPFSEMEEILSDNKLIPKDPSFELSKVKNKFSEVQLIYKNLKEKYSDLNSEVKKAFEATENSFKVLSEETILVLFGEVDYLYSELKNKNNFIVMAPPVQAQEDFVNYQISVKPSKTNTLGAYKNPVSVDFDVPVRGGLKVDFSVGPAFSFGDKARDEQFFFEKVDPDTTENVTLSARTNNNAITPSIGAFMHFYRRSGKNTSFGGLFGVGTGLQSLDDFQVNYYAGLSLVLGKKQKIMLNSGVSFLRVDRLKEDQFVVDEEYMKNEFEISDVVEKVYKPSFFLSLTYSLANRR